MCKLQRGHRLENPLEITGKIKQVNSCLRRQKAAVKLLCILIFLLASCCSRAAQISSLKSLTEANKERAYTEYFPFESYVWAYWDEPIEKAPLFTRLSYERLRMTCEDENLTLTLLSEQNLHQHIEDYERNIADLVKRAKVNYRPTKSDLIRLTILEQKGGIWMDIGCMSIERQKADSSKLMLRGWIERLIKEQKYLVSNAYVKSPEVILFYASFYMNKAQFWDSEYQTTTNEFPGFDTWFIVAKKGSKFIKDFRQNFIKFYLNGFEYITDKLSREQIFQRRQDKDDYLTINMASSYTIQQKQKELDRRLSIFKPFQKRKMVFQEYGIWGVHCMYGPLIFAAHLNDFEKIFTVTKEELEEESGLRIRFMLKFAGYMRLLAEPILNTLKFQFTQKFHNNFTEFIKSEPSQQVCTSLKFIVQGSLFSYLLLDNKVNLQEGIPVITVEQRNQWLSYCDTLVQQSSYFSTLGKKINLGLKKIDSWGSEGRMDKIEYADRYELYSSVEEIPFWDEVEIFLRANTVRVFIFVALWVGLLLIVMPLLAGLIKLIEWGIGRVVENKRINQPEESSESRLSLSISYQGDQKQSGNKWPRYLVFLAYYTTFIIVINFFFNATIQGGVNEVFFTFVVITGTFAVKILAQKYLKDSEETYLKWSYHQLKILFDLFIGYCLCGSVLFLFEKRSEFLVFHTIVIGVMCPIMLQILHKESVSNGEGFYYKTERLILEAIFWIEKFHQHIVLGVLLLILGVPNLPYIVKEDMQAQVFTEPPGQEYSSISTPVLTTQVFDLYYINYLPLIPLTYTFVVALLTLRVIVRQSIESLKELSSSTTTDKTFYNKQLTIIKLSRMLLILGILLMMFRGGWNLRHYIVRIVLPLNKLLYQGIFCFMMIGLWGQVHQNGLFEPNNSKSFTKNLYSESSLSQLQLQNEKSSKKTEMNLRSSQCSHMLALRIFRLVICFLIPFLYMVIGSYQNCECILAYMYEKEVQKTHQINYSLFEIPISIIFCMILYFGVRRRLLWVMKKNLKINCYQGVEGINQDEEKMSMID